MSKSKKSDVQDVRNDANENTNENSATQTRREQLMVEIRSLKLLITTIETETSPMKFEDVSKKKDFPITNERQEFSNIDDVELGIRNELYLMAGVSCKKVGNAFIFGFQCWNIEGPKNSYWIKLYNEVNKWQLGCCIMPMSVNVNDIMKKFSIDSPNDMIYFLRECKHQVDCYNRRKQQYHELETFMSTNGYNFYVEADNSFMQITLKLFRETCSSPDDSRRIRVDLYYKTDETRPSKMIIDSDDVEELSDGEIKKLKIYFKRFKEFDLKDAAEKIFSSKENQFIWRRETQDEAIEIDEDLKDAAEASFMTILKKTATRRKIGKKSRIDHVDLSNSVDTDEELTDDGKKAGKSKKNGKKEHVTKKINVQNNNKIDKSSKKSSTIAMKLPLRDRNENVANLSSKVKMIDKNGKFSKNHIALTSSTPLTGRIVGLSKIDEDEISEIANETPSDEKSRKRRKFEECSSSSESDEKNINEQAELLRDLRASRDQSNSTNKQRKKIKRNTNSLARGGKKMAKK